MPSLPTNLENHRVVGSLVGVIDVGDSAKVRIRASEVLHDAACDTRETHIPGHAIHIRAGETVVAARTGIAGTRHKVSWQLALETDDIVHRQRRLHVSV